MPWRIMDEPCHYWQWVLSISAQDKKPPSVISHTICVFAFESLHFHVLFRCVSGLALDWHSNAVWCHFQGHSLFRNQFVFDTNILALQITHSCPWKCYHLLWFHQGKKKKTFTLPKRKMWPSKIFICHLCRWERPWMPPCRRCRTCWQ